MKKLTGKIAIITGGSTGIGLATAKLFLQEGAKLVLTSRNEKRGQEIVKNISLSTDDVVFIKSDVRQKDDCARVVQETIAFYGRLDILFNNAGVIFIDKSVVNTSEEIWDTTLDVNLKGTYLMSRFAVPEMVKTGGGVVINNASVFGLVGGSGAAAYCAAKGGTVLLTKAMALDHAAQNIRVNCICPGSVDTPMLREEMSALGDIEKIKPKFEARHPMNRISSPEEVAKAVLFLASDDASFITGTALSVDGGRSAW